MKVKLTIQQRTNLRQLIEAPQLGGGTSLGEIKMMLELVDKLDYKGDKNDPTILTELELDNKQITKLYTAANNFSGWPVKEWVLDMKERLEEYNE